MNVGSTFWFVGFLPLFVLVGCNWTCNVKSGRAKLCIGQVLYSHGWAFDWHLFRPANSFARGARSGYKRIQTVSGFALYLQARKLVGHIGSLYLTICVLFLFIQGSVQQLLDKKNDMENQNDICTILGWSQYQFASTTLHCFRSSRMSAL